MFSKRSTLALMAALALSWYQLSKGNIAMAILYYCLMSKLWLTFPTLLHQTRTKFAHPFTRPGYKQLIIAHRGGSWEAPENTL